MRRKVIPTGVRLSVSTPIFLGYFFNIAYGIYFYQFFKIDFSCQHIIPKLIKYLDVFPPDQFCTANSFLWTALVVFLVIDLLIVATVAIVNRNIRLARDQIAFAPGLLRAILIWSTALALCILAYVYLDLKISRSNFQGAASEISGNYVWHQIVTLHVALGLVNFIDLACFLPRFYRNINQ
jgi:hypothetical protein